MNIHIVETDRGAIEYSTLGKGKPVLFLHGGHANCRDSLPQKGFNPLHYQLITPSRPGYGNTPINGHVTAKQGAEVMVALLDTLGIEKVVLYAVSAGGLTGIEIASNYPDRVEKLILASAVAKKWLPKASTAYKTGKIMFHPRMEKLVWGMIRATSQIFPRLIARSFYSQFSSIPAHRLDSKDIAQLIDAFRIYGSGSGFLIDIDHDMEEGIIDRISCPTLIIHSQHDSSVPFEHAEFAYNRIFTSQLIPLENEWGHLFWLGKDADKSVKLTIDFIEDRVPV